LSKLIQKRILQLLLHFMIFITVLEEIETHSPQCLPSQKVKMLENTKAI